MKKKFFKYIPIALGAIMMMASCADDDEENPLNDNPTVPKPTVEVSVNGETGMDIYEVLVGETIVLNMSAFPAVNGGANLDVVSLSQQGVNATNNFILMASESGDPYDFSTAAEVDIKNVDNERLILSDTLSNITVNTGETTYDFTVKDKDGLIGTSSFKIQVNNPTTPFTSTETGEIWHIAGQNRGSWSLTQDTSIAIANSESEAEIVNTDAAAATFTGEFKVGDNLSSTTFVKAATSFDYANATVESAEIAYTNGTASTSTLTAPTVDDVYIFKLDNGNHAVVKITSIDPNADCGVGCLNTGKMEFEYKK